MKVVREEIDAVGVTGEDAEDRGTRKGMIQYSVAKVMFL